MPITYEDLLQARPGDHFYGFPDFSFEVIETNPDAPCPIVKLLSPSHKEIEAYFDGQQLCLVNMLGRPIAGLDHPDALFAPQAPESQDQQTKMTATSGWLTEDFII